MELFDFHGVNKSVDKKLTYKLLSCSQRVTSSVIHGFEGSGAQMKASYSAYCSHLWTKLPTKDRKTKGLGLNTAHAHATFSQSSCPFPTLFKSPFFTVPIHFSPNSLPLLQFPLFHPSVNTSFLLQFSFSLLFQALNSLFPPFLCLSPNPYFPIPFPFSSSS